MRIKIIGTAEEIACMEGFNAYVYWPGAPWLENELSYEGYTFVVEEPKRRRPGVDEPYWYIDETGTVQKVTDTSGLSVARTKRYAACNYFESGEDAEAAAEKIRAVFRGE